MVFGNTIVFAFFVTFCLKCFLCDETADFENLDTDDVFIGIPPPLMLSRPLGIQPIQVEVGVAATLTGTKYDHFKRLTGKQHPHLSGTYNNSSLSTISNTFLSFQIFVSTCL